MWQTTSSGRGHRKKALPEKKHRIDQAVSEKEGKGFNVVKK